MHKKNLSREETDLKIGTIGFWVQKNELNWNNNEAVVLVNIIKSDGSLFIVKDSDNKLKCFHVILGKGRTDIETDVSAFDKNKAYMIVITWDTTESKKLSLYIDDKEVVSKNIVY